MKGGQKQAALNQVQPDKFTAYTLAKYPGRRFRPLTVGCGPSYPPPKRLEELGGEAHGLEISEYAQFEPTPAIITKMLHKEGFEVVELLNPVKPPKNIRLGGGAMEKASWPGGTPPTT